MTVTYLKRAAPRQERIHKEYKLPFADMGVGADLREVWHESSSNRCGWRRNVPNQARSRQDSSSLPTAADVTACAV